MISGCAFLKAILHALELVDMKEGCYASDDAS